MFNTLFSASLLGSLTRSFCPRASQHVPSSAPSRSEIRARSVFFQKGIKKNHLKGGILFKKGSTVGQRYKKIGHVILIGESWIWGCPHPGNTARIFVPSARQKPALLAKIIFQANSYWINLLHWREHFSVLCFLTPLTLTVRPDKYGKLFSYES